MRCVTALTILSRSAPLPSQRISLTEERVLISKADEPLRVFDFINLDEVVECELKADDEPVQHTSGRPDSPDSAVGGIEKDPDNLELIIRTMEDGDTMNVWLLEIHHACSITKCVSVCLHVYVCVYTIQPTISCQPGRG